MADITGTTQVPAPINVAFQRELLANAKPKAPYFAGTVPASIAEKSGSLKASWHQIKNLTPTTSALSEITGTLSLPTRTGTQASTTNVQATLAKYGQFVILNETVDMTVFNTYNAKLAEVLGISAGRSLNQLQRNEEEDNGTAILAGGAGSATAISTKISRNDIRNAVNVLNRNSAMKFTPQTTGDGNFNTSPIRDSYWGLTHPDVEEDIRDLQGFIAVEQYASQTRTMPGEFGAVGGVRFIASEDSSIDAEAGKTTSAAALGLRTGGNDAVDLYNTVIYGKEAFGSVGLGTAHLQEVYQAGDELPGVMVINHGRGTSGAADPLNEIATLGWKSWHAAAVLDGSWARVVRSGASDLSK